MLKLKQQLNLPTIGLTGFEPPMSEEENAIQHSVHQFAKNVLRPIGRELDRMTPEQVIAPGSPLYTAYMEAAKLGLDSELLAQMPADMAIRVESMVGEEFGWGDVGLGVALAVANFPLEMARAAGKQELIDMVTGKIGCWMITHPDKGTDVGAFNMARDWTPGQPGNKGNLLAKVGHDEVVINGQCSAWVSGAPVAQVALAYLTADYGDGFLGADGLPNGIAMIIPLDLPGITKGKPLDKIGQRSLPQGEVYFDNVRVPKRFAVALKDEYYGNVGSAWSFAGTHMSQLFTGLSRAAFEMALHYANERKVGGQLMAKHQLTQYRLGDMMRRVEMCRGVARRSLAYARQTPNGHPWATASAKVTITEEAERIVMDAFRIFGGNGTTREYPIEKLVRDARSALIEDGENMMLTTRLGSIVQQMYEEGWTQN